MNINTGLTSCYKNYPWSVHVPVAESYNVAKCNLGKVKLRANAVSGLLLKRT